ncbi:metallophosphoesterase [Bartonella tamiae]|uniref:Calcineurin-like phosphoesterase domain-containing protein n=1 Tax=Bartonella tamiae Th239 TaxID=1094558 RepID=J0QY61_9HYPH|nr:metallophosphoesterase [Bartonella tamiae]EJF91031.1 hypothetical protein ME5_00363 [Bartonella tamiae Th239]EJF93304.1 hypothetical protein MEG_01518 [Bartonella tamiae Th307]
MPVNFIHLTDLHIGNPDIYDEYLHTDTDATLQTILGQIQNMKPTPEFIVVSGDLTNRGDDVSYQRLRYFFASYDLPMPVYFALGNHDKRDGFYKAMLDRENNLEQPYYYDVVQSGIHLIVLDSSVPGKIGGALEPEQFEWLQIRLDAHAHLPKLIMVHHAPALDEDCKDNEWESLTIEDTKRLKTMLQGYNIAGILSGHIHYDRVSTWYNIPIVVGIGMHTALDPTYIHYGLRGVTGASYSLCCLRNSGLTVSFVPLPSERKELDTISHEDRIVAFQKYEERIQKGC